MHRIISKRSASSVLKVVSSSKLAFVLLLNQTAFPALYVSSATLSVPPHEMDAHVGACVCSADGWRKRSRWQLPSSHPTKADTGLQLNAVLKACWKRGRAGGFQGEHEKAVEQKNRDVTFRSDGRSQSERRCQLLFQQLPALCLLLAADSSNQTLEGYTALRKKIKVWIRALFFIPASPNYTNKVYRSVDCLALC